MSNVVLNKSRLDFFYSQDSPRRVSYGEAGAVNSLTVTEGAAQVTGEALKQPVRPHNLFIIANIIIVWYNNCQIQLLY